MKRYIALVVVLSVLLGSNPRMLSAQEEADTEPQTTPLTEAGLDWVWGEIVSVDNDRNALVVKTLDYETQEEEEVELFVDNNTVYENVTALTEIKPGNTVSIDCVVNQEDIRVATYVGVDQFEMEEETPSLEQPAETTP